MGDELLFLWNLEVMLFVIELHGVNKGPHRWLGSEVVLNQQTYAVKCRTISKNHQVKEACGEKNNLIVWSNVRLSITRAAGSYPWSQSSHFQPHFYLLCL